MVREWPCCLCKAVYSDFKEDVCPDCNFVKAYIDERGWIYFVRSGIGPCAFKTFYKQPGKGRIRGCRMTEWRKSFADAQRDLHRLAKEKGWKEVDQDG